ncbi:MAG TPA: STAS domain-containing protein [Actinomycetota bacterium]|nr:STAS domain-containing protein [Actinomycetota bacterium]
MGAHDWADVRVENRPEGVACLAVVGEADIADVPRIRKAIDSAFCSGPSALIVDLRGVTFMGSEGLRLLLETQLCARRRRTDLRIHVAPGPAYRVMTITGCASRLPLMLEEAPTIESANGRPAERL